MVYDKISHSEIECDSPLPRTVQPENRLQNNFKKSKQNALLVPPGNLKNKGNYSGDNPSKRIEVCAEE